jgi:hypothetical protein
MLPPWVKQFFPLLRLFFSVHPTRDKRPEENYKRGQTQPQSDVVCLLAQKSSRIHFHRDFPALHDH